MCFPEYSAATDVLVTNADYDTQYQLTMITLLQTFNVILLHNITEQNVGLPAQAVCLSL